jgi:multicomponent K+:H+ antiporter subunit D
MNHWLIVPILLPALTAVTLLLTARADRFMHRALSVLATLCMVGLAFYLNELTWDGTRHVYSLGNWPAPFGIVLVVDRFSALMVLLTSVVAVGALMHAIQGWDTRGRNFHALFQFQLMGLNGAFLTGDIFNLFVFFEVLLIASYALLLHGGGKERVRAGLHYVIFNLVGSALFITALGLLYGTLGTLNMADMAVRVAELDPGSIPIARGAFLLLLIVFSIKAAALPLYFWLPSAYTAACPPVASLFAIMTKVGIYAIVRVSTLMLGDTAGPLSGLGDSTFLWVGVTTSIAAALGLLASRDLRQMVAYLVIASVGLLLIAIGLDTVEARAAMVFYMVHSTLVTAGFFLLVEAIATRRGRTSTAIKPGLASAPTAMVGALFFVYVMAAVGLPPLTGFLGKVFLLKAAVASPNAATLFVVILGAGFLALIATSRAGTTIFWKPAEYAAQYTAQYTTDPPSAGEPVWPVPYAPALVHLAVITLLTITAGSALDVATGIAEQLSDSAGYVEAVMSATTIDRS